MRPYLLLFALCDVFWRKNRNFALKKSKENLIEMTNIILSDIRGVHQELLPITYTRTPAHIRLGINTIGEK